MKKKYTVIAIILTLAFAGGMFWYGKTQKNPTTPPNETPEGSFVRFEVPGEWTKPQVKPTELPPFSISEDKFLDKPIQIYRVETDAPIILKGAASPDIEKLEVTWMLINTSGYTGNKNYRPYLSAPKKDWVTLPIENFSPGDTTWTFKAELLKNLDTSGYSQQYTVVGTKISRQKVYGYLLLKKIPTDNDYKYLQNRQDMINKPIIEGAKGFAGDLERYLVDEYSSTTITDDVRVYVLRFSDEYCEVHSKTFIEMNNNCSGYSGNFIVAYDRKKQKNYYLQGGLSSQLSGGIFFYKPQTQTLGVGYFPEGSGEGLAPGEKEKPRIISTIDLSRILAD